MLFNALYILPCNFSTISLAQYVYTPPWHISRYLVDSCYICIYSRRCSPKHRMTALTVRTDMLRQRECANRSLNPPSEMCAMKDL